MHNDEKEIKAQAEIDAMLDVWGVIKEATREYEEERLLQSPAEQQLAEEWRAKLLQLPPEQQQMAMDEFKSTAKPFEKAD